MNQMPTTKAMFGYDVIGSSANDDDKLDEVRAYAAKYVTEALDLAKVEVNDRTNYSPTGDGALACYPETSLPQLIDATYHLDGKLHGHNRRYLPPVRLRVSIHTGPVRISDEETFQRRTIELARGLDASTFKEIVRRMDRFAPSTVAVILSDQAYRVAVLGGYTERLRSHNFGDVEIANKEFNERCWVHVPGIDRERVRELSHPDPVIDKPTGARPTPPSTPGYFQGNSVGGDNSGSMVARFGESDRRP
ncbi:hypothetical protein [Amycolatopsis sp.]|jgi:hypothetical protein|uniref:hypothetical protein n=1 Tax=Amycolatopsis sp. TaxID=37632 RepID=UPI002DFF745E|nr:hypothetical protein [Amycolatopsis sp.]